MDSEHQLRFKFAQGWLAGKVKYLANPDLETRTVDDDNGVAQVGGGSKQDHAETGRRYASV